MKRTILICLALSLIISLVYAAPPVSTVQQFSEGYYIEIPQITIFEQGHSYEFEVHVFNISNGVAKTSGIGCYFHLYNKTGKHMLELYDETPSHQFDYSFEVSGGNFTTFGELHYIVQCNGSKLGGFTGQQILITPNGEELTEAQGILLFSAILVILFSSIILFLVSYKSENIAWKIIFVGLAAIAIIIAILFTLVAVTQGLGRFQDIVDGYATFWFVAKILIGIAIVVLLIFTLIISWNVWMVRKGFRD